MIYLMSPYSHEEEVIREGRYLAAEIACVAFWRQGIPVYSPIVHWHNAAKRYKLPSDNAPWKAQNMGVLVRCSRTGILMLDGWKDSIGIRDEVKEIRRLHIGDHISLYRLSGTTIIRTGKLEDHELR